MIFEKLKLKLILIGVGLLTSILLITSIIIFFNVSVNQVSTDFSFNILQKRVIDSKKSFELRWEIVKNNSETSTNTNSVMGKLDIENPADTVYYFNQAKGIDSIYLDGGWDESDGPIKADSNGNVMGSIASSGCGPTSMAIIAKNLTGDNTFTPAKVVKDFLNLNLYVCKNPTPGAGSGSDNSSGMKASAYYGFKSEIQPDNNINNKEVQISWLKDHLSKGHFIYAIVKDGDGSKSIHNPPSKVWKGTGHFVVFVGLKDNKTMCFDCGSLALNRKWYDLEVVWGETRVNSGMTAIWK